MRREDREGENGWIRRMRDLRSAPRSMRQPSLLHREVARSARTRLSGVIAPRVYGIADRRLRRPNKGDSGVVGMRAVPAVPEVERHTPAVRGIDLDGHRPAGLKLRDVEPREERRAVRFVDLAPWCVDLQHELHDWILVDGRAGVDQAHDRRRRGLADREDGTGLSWSKTPLVRPSRAPRTDEEREREVCGRLGRL